MKIYIQALELNLNPEDLKKAIPEEKLKKLKGKGILQAYTLAHEGMSRPKVLGEGNQVLKWPRAVIRRIAEKIKEGTKFFLGHGETNAQEGRTPVGEVLSSFVKEIGGRLSHIIIGHFPDEEKVKEMDICSMEADVYTDNENIVGDVNEISGIALASSDTESPAFPGALRLGTVQCFNESGQNLRRKEKDMALTFEEVRAAVRQMNIFPHQLYNIEEIKNDRTFSKIFTDNETLKIENEKLKKENADIQNKSKEAIRQLDITKATAKLETFMEDLTDKQKKFITKQFKPELLEKLDDDGIKEFIENSKKEFAETAKLFGAEVLTDTKKTSNESEEDEDKTMAEKALKELGVD
ncbi:MAG: hypothetical protein ACTSPI_00390 [Candidatus Heimdallarchaeaceae archaeon]